MRCQVLAGLNTAQGALPTGGIPSCGRGGRPASADRGQLRGRHPPLPGSRSRRIGSTSV